MSTKGSARRVAEVGTYSEDVEATLYDAVKSRLGVPYRLSGTDNRGYDCSGFVWSVFQEAGIEFDRTSARLLWERLPEAREREQLKFGTLVFFDGLSHVGIVRDAYSFYHASSSQGVVRSYFSANNGYWARRVIGFRRAVAGELIEPVRWRTKGKWGIRPVRPRQIEDGEFPFLPMLPAEEEVAMTDDSNKKKKKRDRRRD
ncbi:MAG: C40 family peptidase [Blastocatellia bacterium]|nr:C40 family peptidase [Blastocatellia bacterium]